MSGMTDSEIKQWIDACNHEPARQVLRDFIRLRGEAASNGFVIRGPFVDDEWLYWSDTDGWQSRESATVFYNKDVIDPIETTRREPVAAPEGQAVAERHNLYGTRWITQLRDMEPGTQWFIAGRADPIATVKSGTCVIWHCSEADIPHGTKYYTRPQPAAPAPVAAPQRDPNTRRPEWTGMEWKPAPVAGDAVAKLPEGQAVAERHNLYGTRWITQLRDMEPGTQWFIAGRDDPIATVKSGTCVIWHCSEADIPHGTKYYTRPQPAAPVGVEAVVREAVAEWEECKSPLAAQHAMFKIANDLRANEAERALAQDRASQDSKT